MAAYVAIESFTTLDENGDSITVPIGARVEKDDHYYNALPEAFREENPKAFFGRVNPGSNTIQPTAVLTTLVPEEVTVSEPEPEALTEEPEPAAADAPKSSVGRRTLPRK